MPTLSAVWPNFAMIPFIVFSQNYLNYKYLENDEGEFYFSLNDLNAEIIKVPRVKAIVILNQTKMTASASKPVHPTKVIPHIFPSSIRPGSHNTDRNFNFLTELIDHVHCYQVDFGTDMHDFYLTIKKILDD
ncbi:MAG: hypothetical protein U5N58_02710 [Actinomycetota bacterium]|nr:hypothetical protein [Actinomycetota bacterium]